MTIKIKRFAKNAVVPVYAHAGDSGMDVAVTHSFVLPAKRTVKVMTGIGVELPDGYEVQVRPRSGLAARHGVFAVFGTVDAGYRGEIGVTLVNMGDADLAFDAGDRIAQLVIAPVVRAEVVTVDSLSSSERGENGFGSTGV